MLTNVGFFSHHLLIGNAGSGQIAVYDVDSGRFDGLLLDANGHTIQNDRLLAIRFWNDHAAARAIGCCWLAKMLFGCEINSSHRYHNPPI